MDGGGETWHCLNCGALFPFDNEEEQAVEV